MEKSSTKFDAESIYLIAKVCNADSAYKVFKGPSINDVSSKREGGVKNVGIYLVKRRQRGKEGGHKNRKMG